MEKNIYIKAMEIGLNNPTGIEYRALKEQLEKFMGKQFNFHSEYALIEWLFTSFTTVDSIRKYRHATPLEALHLFLRSNKQAAEYVNSYKDLTLATFVFKGTATKHYFDYLELKESREQASKAFKTAVWSIIIAIATLLSSVAIEVFNLFI